MRFLNGVLLMLIAVFVCDGAAAQVLKGVVVSAQTGEPLYPVTVVNVVTQQSTYTNQQGEFAISAKSGNQLAFSFIGYKTQQKAMPPTLNIANERVEMEPLTYQLQDVIIRPGWTKYQKDSIARRETYARPLARQKVTSIMSPVSLIADKISRKSQQTYRFQKSFNYWEGERFIDSRYTPELVSILTDLNGDTLAHFMNAYPMPYDYARTATELEIKMWIRNNFKEWIAKPHTIVTDTLNKQ
ncbi:MAG: hypothetical protein EOP51_05175 [Sphingobacteriales bacterium]|nr:MAG: hypothetical protein EOP51_05175 [Sphingobacteriales bacterium]